MNRAEHLENYSAVHEGPVKTDSEPRRVGYQAVFKLMERAVVESRVVAVEMMQVKIPLVGYRTAAAICRTHSVPKAGVRIITERGT